MATRKAADEEETVVPTPVPAPIVRPADQSDREFASSEDDPARSATGLDGMPVRLDDATKMVIDPESGAIVSVPVDDDTKEEGKA